MSKWHVTGHYAQIFEAETEQDALDYALDKIGNGWEWEATEAGAGAERGVTFSRGQLEAWTGRTLTDDDLAELEEAAPNSSIPEAFDLIADGGDIGTYREDTGGGLHAPSS